VATSDTPLRLANEASKIKSVGQARAALGVVAEVLRRAYDRLPEVSGMADLDEAARDRLDVVNNYAQGLFAMLPGDDIAQRKPVTPLMASKIGLAIGQAHRAVKDIDEAAAFSGWDFVALLAEAIREAAELAGKAAQGTTNAILAALFAFLRAAWPTVLIVVVALVVVWKVRGRVVRLLTGGAA
jgi:hypothetical protein